MGSQTIIQYWVDENGDFVVEEAGVRIVVGQLSAYSGEEVTLAVSPAGTGTYVTIAQVRDIDGPGLNTDAVDSRTRDDDNATFEAGWHDGGEITFDIVYDPATATHANAGNGLLAMQTAGAAADWRITFPGPTNWDMSGLVTKFQPTAPLEDMLSGSVTIKISGEPTLA